jgi:GNAT superfamily N-acetyltransferase
VGLDVNIRDAVAADVPGMTEVLRHSISELCAEDHRNDPAMLSAWLGNKTVESVSAWLKRSDSSHLLAEEQGVLPGVGAVTDLGQVLLNDVAPTARFRGVSKALIQACEERARERGSHRVTLNSTITAQRFYERQGYALTGPSPGKFGMSGGFPMAKALRKVVSLVPSESRSDT